MDGLLADGAWSSCVRVRAGRQRVENGSVGFTSWTRRRVRDPEFRCCRTSGLVFMTARSAWKGLGSLLALLALGAPAIAQERDPLAKLDSTSRHAVQSFIDSAVAEG